MFCLNCIFVIDAAAVKQLVSRSFFKYGVSAVAMAAHEIFFKIKSNRHCTHFIKLAAVPKHGSEWRGPTPRLSAWATQVRRNVAAVASLGNTVSDLTDLVIKPQIFRIDSDMCNTTL